MKPGIFILLPFFVLTFSGRPVDSLCSAAAEDTIRVKRNVDTLKLLQGDWEFRHALATDNPRRKDATTCIATSMHIDSTRFIMRLSEAAERGTIKRKNNRFVFEFIRDNMYVTDSAATYYFNDMEIARIDKERLYLLRRNYPKRAYVKGATGNGDILLIYVRR